MASSDDGATAVRLAREAIERSLSRESGHDPAEPFRTRELPRVFDAPMGVFVTLESYPSGQLRGCIGYPVGVFPLRVGLPRVAAAAALEDPRFPSLTEDDLSRVTVEVSLLTPPDPLEATPRSELPKKVRVGIDGLIIDHDGRSGLLLPQVAVEQGWDGLEFLRETCVKGGMRPNAWLSPDVRVRRFGSERFHEERPGGPVRSAPVTGAEPALPRSG